PAPSPKSRRHVAPLYFSYRASWNACFSPLSLHDALPILTLAIVLAGAISTVSGSELPVPIAVQLPVFTKVWLLDRNFRSRGQMTDRKSTRLNSSHRTISYAVFCLKKKNKEPYSHFDP